MKEGVVAENKTRGLGYSQPGWDTIFSQNAKLCGVVGHPTEQNTSLFM